MQVVPGALVGAWRRVALEVGGAAVPEQERATWLQAAERFVDLRRPLADGAAPVAFGGRTAVDDPRVRWSHDVELDPWPDEDGADVEWRGADLVERGSVVVGDERYDYVEVWRRLEPAGATVAVASRTSGSGLALRVGAYAATLLDERPTSGFRACLWRLDGGRWTVEWALGPDATDLPRADDAPAPWRPERP